jgi:multicomponent Na+:H+ antiporter subunit A
MSPPAPHRACASAQAPALGLATRAGFVLLPLTALILVVTLLVQFDLPRAGAVAWVPALGISLAWRIDGLAALMLLMITGVGSAVFVYAGGYLAGHPGQRRLYVLLTLFMLAMIGCVTADDLFTLFLFWEATSLLSFLLVGFNHGQPGSRKSAQQALLVTGTGGLALLAGLILIGQVMGTSSINAIVERLPATPPSPALTAGVLLMIVGAFTKSAQFPFHFWLPNAMAAPTPVSAYLHSATMVKLGVYLLARMDAGLDAWPLWQLLLQGAGSITAAWGMVLALRERDLKRILAWSTVATLGTLVALVGMPGEGAAVAVGALLLAHALYKAPLFFVAGNVDHGAGTRVIDHLGNLRHAMPWTAAAAALAGMSMAGIPLSFGYVVKDLVGDAKAASDVLAFAPLANAVFSAIAVAVAGVAAVRVFWRHPGTNETPQAHECGLAMVLPPLVLAGFGVALGLFPVWAQPMVESVGVAMTPGTDPVLAPLARVLGPELLSFAATFAIGGVVFLLWDPLHRVVDALASRLARFSLAAQYERSLGGIPRLAAVCTRWLQHGRSPDYMAVAAAVAVLAVGLPLAMAAPALAWPAVSLPPLGVAGGVLLIATGALAAAVLKERLVLLLGAGLVGYASAVIFLFAGAPDVAFTQVVVETVFVIVIAAVLLALKRRGKAMSVAEPGVRPLALVLSLAFATVLTALLLSAVAVPFDDTLSRWFGEQSVPAAQGRNVVNVILVDFRALDTLGEITVVMLSLLAAVPLLRSAHHRRGPSAGR